MAEDKLKVPVPMYNPQRHVFARPTLAVPSIHQLISDAQISLADALERNRTLRSDNSLGADEKRAIQKQLSVEVALLKDALKTIQSLREEQAAMERQLAQDAPSVAETIRLLFESLDARARRQVLKSIQQSPLPGEG